MTTKLIQELVGLAVDKNNRSLFKVDILISERTVEVLSYGMHVGGTSRYIDKDNSMVVDLLYFDAPAQLQAVIDKIKEL